MGLTVDEEGVVPAHRWGGSFRGCLECGVMQFV